MKILHVCSNYYPATGGPQYTMKQVSEKLVADFGDEVEVITSNSYYGPESALYEKITPAFEVINGVRVKRFAFNRWHYQVIRLLGKAAAKLFKKRLPQWLLKKRWGMDAPAIDRAMKHAQADVIMATTIIYNFADYPLWRFKTPNPKPFVMYGAIHLAEGIQNETFLFDRARSADCYIANTNFEKEALVKYGVQADKIVVTGTGVSIEDFKCNPKSMCAFRNRLGLKDEDVLLGFTGKLSKGKGLGTLLEAFKLLYASYPNLKLVAAGNTTDYVPEALEYIRSHQLPVTLLENFKDDEKSDLFNALDIFILPSPSESFGAVFLEAWACKKPVVGANIGAVASLINAGSDGLLFEPKDAVSLSAVSKPLIEDKTLRYRLGLNGYEKVLNHFNWPVVIEKYRNAYLMAIKYFNERKAAAST